MRALTDEQCYELVEFGLCNGLAIDAGNGLGIGWYCNDAGGCEYGESFHVIPLRVSFGIDCQGVNGIRH